MSKRIRLSSDNITYYTLPTPEGDLNRTINTVDASTLGQTFADEFPTIIDWEMSSQGLVKGAAAYCGRILKSGISTAIVGAPLTLVSGQEYQITAAANQILDYQVTPVIYDDGVDVTSQVQTFNYLVGKIVFLGTYTVVGAITADVNYLPTATFGKTLSFSLTQSVNVVDDSSYQEVCSNGGFRVNKQGIRTVALSFDGIYDAANDFNTLINSRDTFIVELDPQGDGKSVARGYFRVTDLNQGGAVGDNESESVEFSLSVPSPDFIPFTWQHAIDSTLDPAVRIALDAFESESDVFVQYLPDGTTGSDGKGGSTVVTDVTLESSIEDINRFSLAFTGDGALIDV